jgi:CheY-like chemotaxis protein
LLEGAGHAVIEARDGREALERLRAGRVGLVLLDLWMPVMNGWEFRSEQRKDPALAGIPVVVITADHAAAHHAERFGAVAWMTKPVDFDRLLELVDRHC